VYIDPTALSNDENSQINSVGMALGTQRLLPLAPPPEACKCDGGRIVVAAAGFVGFGCGSTIRRITEVELL